MDEDFWARLTTPFHPDKVEWRIGSTTQDKKKGMALAYIDSRTVMERFDSVCGPANWQCLYPHAGDKTSCKIAIKVDDEWVWKEDGAGNTDFEGTKGAFSDAFKRAAVKWGVGRYLYDLKSPWVEIEVKGRTTAIKDHERPKLRALLGSGRQPSAEPVIGALNKTELQKRLRAFDTDLRAVEDADSLYGLLESYKDVLDQCRTDLPSWWNTKPGADALGVSDRIEKRKQELEGQSASGNQDGLALISPQGEIEKEWPRTSRNASDFMRQLEIACGHSSLYWKFNGPQARDIAEKLPRLTVDTEPVKAMVERLESQFGNITDMEDGGPSPLM